jgi:hypothetical protein
MGQVEVGDGDGQDRQDEQDAADGPEGLLVLFDFLGRMMRAH